MNNKNVYYENNTWHHNTKTLHNGTIAYGKKGGFQSEKQAQQAYNRHINQFESKIARIKKAQNVHYTFTEYIAHWFEDIYLMRANGSSRLGFAYVLHHFILPTVTLDVLLVMVTTEYLNKLMEECSKFTDSSGPMTRKFLSVAFGDAYVDGLISSNPMDNAAPYYWNVPAVTVLKKEEIKKLLAEATYYSNHTFYLEVLLALFCGLRKGEIIGLKKSDIDIGAKTLHVQRQITRDYDVILPDEDSGFTCVYSQSVKPPKSTKGDRVLKVHDVIIKEIDTRLQQIDANRSKSMQSYCHETYDEGYLCVGKKGKVKSDSYFNEAICKVCSRAGIPSVSMHALRHNYATILIEQNVPLHKISMLLGHESVNTTFEIYCGIMNGLNEINHIVNETFDPVKTATSFERKGVYAR